MYKKLDEKTIEAILESGIDVFVEKGLRGAGMNEIAKRSGVSVGVIYKYFSDKDGTKEIKKADTVTAKLKDDSKSPQTGDTSNLALWIALLFVSGGAAIGTTVVSRKKKYNR